MTTFHSLKGARIEPETRDAVTITFAIPTLAKPAAESGNAIPMPLLAILAAEVRKKSLKMRLARACSSSGSARPERKACSSRTSPWLVHRRSEISQKLQLYGMRGEATLRAIIIR